MHVGAKFYGHFGEVNGACAACLCHSGVRVNFHHGVGVNLVAIVFVTNFYVPSFLVKRGGGNETFFH